MHIIQNYPVNTLFHFIFVFPFLLFFFFIISFNIQEEKKKRCTLNTFEILYSKTDRDTLNLTANFLRVEPSLSCFIFYFLFLSTPVHWLHFYFFTFVPHLHTTIINLLISFLVLL